MNFFRDKRGIIARILSTIPTFFIIVLIMGFFLIVTGFFSLLRGANAPAFIEGVDAYDADNGVLFDVVEIDGERFMLLDGLIKDSLYRDGEKDIRERIKVGGFSNAEEESSAKEKINDISRYGINLRESIKRLLEIKREGCFISFFEKGKPVLSNLRSSRDIYFVVNNGKVDNGNIGELEAYYDAGLLKEVSLNTNTLLDKQKKSFEFYMQYYFGKCYSYNERPKFSTKLLVLSNIATDNFVNYLSQLLYNELQKLIKERRENG